MKKKPKIFRYGVITGKNGAYKLVIDDRENIVNLLAETFGTGVRLRITWEEFDVEQSRSDMVHYRVNCLPFLTHCANEVGNNWETEQMHEQLKKLYFKEHAPPSLSSLGKAELKRFVAFVETFSLDWFGVPIPRYDSRPLPPER
jgi:hypothetical protein